MLNQISRSLILILTALFLVSLLVGAEPSCALVLRASPFADSCKVAHGERLAQHLNHADSTFPQMFLLNIVAVGVLALLVLILDMRPNLPHPRLVQLTPEQPPRFA